MNQIILASGSPRRKELLEQMGLTFEVCPAKGEEVITTTIPSDVVAELSRQKAEEIAGGILSWIENGCKKELSCPQDVLVIGADTVVAFEGKILGKPKDEADAKRMLSMLSGNTHSVFTGVTFVFIDQSGKTGEYTFYEKTDVTMYDMSEEEIERYIATGEPMDKAGAYGIQGKGAIYIQGILGDFYNVMGLPIGKLYQELRKLGIDIYLW